MDNLWIKAALVRAIKTIAQTAVATIGSAAVLSAVDWRIVVSASLLAGILSILTSVAGLPEVHLAETQIEDADMDDDVTIEELLKVLAETDDDDDDDDDEPEAEDEELEDPEDDEELPQ
jgi:hypothetical protein